MTIERPLFDPALASEVERWREASRLEGSAAGLQTALHWLRDPDGPLTRADEPPVARAIATIAAVDMSVAFSFWAHQMVVTYVEEADDDAFRSAWTERLRTAEVTGSTALAAAMACHVTGAPLPITATNVAGSLELSGSIAWASNLFRPHFLLVTAAELPGGGRRIVALRGRDAGLAIAPFPALIDLQETASSSIRLDGAVVHPENVVALDFERFISRVRPRFLLWQSCFCWGLAARSLSEGGPHVRRGITEVFAGDHGELTTELDRVERAILGELEADEARRRRGELPSGGTILAIVKLRLAAAQLAGTATRLEAKVVGGRGYLAQSATARRLREAAFLPIQSPTEGQLRWELSRSI